MDISRLSGKGACHSSSQSARQLAFPAHTTRCPERHRRSRSQPFRLLQYTGRPQARRTLREHCLPRRSCLSTIQSGWNPAGLNRHADFYVTDVTRLAAFRQQSVIIGRLGLPQPVPFVMVSGRNDSYANWAMVPKILLTVRLLTRRTIRPRSTPSSGRTASNMSSSRNPVGGASLVQVAEQPGLCEVPLSLNGPAGDAEHFCRLLFSKSAKKT